MQCRRTTSIARSDLPPPRRSMPNRFAESFALLLLEPLKQLLPFLEIFHSEPARLDQVRHQRLGPAAKDREKFIDETPLRSAAHNGRFEHMHVADFLREPHGFLC